jgi:hypothetical protein
VVDAGVQAAGLDEDAVEVVEDRVEIGYAHAPDSAEPRVVESDPVAAGAQVSRLHDDEPGRGPPLGKGLIAVQ